jgi:hypothetical protein
MYTDPDGRAPNQAGVTNPDHVLNALIADPNLANLKATHQGNMNRYFYTEKYGWVDIRHFAEAARMTYDQPGWTVKTLGFFLEGFQWMTEWGDDYRSGFSPEDLPSNTAGFDFGLKTREINPVTAFRVWFQEAGGKDLSEIMDKVNALPLTDPSERGGKNRGASNLSSTPPGRNGIVEMDYNYPRYQ